MMRLLGYVSVFKINSEYNTAHQDYAEKINSIRLQAYDKLGDSSVDAIAFKNSLIEQEKEATNNLAQVESYYKKILNKK
jgi:hypothetical protein